MRIPGDVRQQLAYQVCRVAAASERASAADGAGDGGATVGSWRGPRGCPGGGGERDHGAPGRGGVGLRRGPAAGRPGPPCRWRTQTAEAHDPHPVAALLALVEPDERGDPMSPLRWTTKSLRQPGRGADRRAIRCRRPPWRVLRATGSACRATPRPWRVSSIPTGTRSSATSTSRSRPTRRAGDPVISVDTKKKEQLGRLQERAAASGARKASRSRSRTTTSSTGPTRQGHPLRGLRHGREHRLGQRRSRPRHGRVRRRLHPPLVAGPGPAGLPGRRPAADHRRRRRFQRLPRPALEGGTGGVRRRDGTGDHGVPLPAGHQQMEQDRAPAVLPRSP